MEDRMDSSPTIPSYFHLISILSLPLCIITLRPQTNQHITVEKIPTQPPPHRQI